MARYWVAGGNGNTNSTTNWSATDGGASGASVPTNADDVVFNSNSGSDVVTVNATLQALSLNLTGFNGTLAGSSTIQIYSGGITLGTTVTLTHTGTISAAASGGSWTSNGKQWTGNISIGGSFSVTYIDNWDIVGNFTNSATSTPQGSVITVRGNLNINAFASSSTTGFILAGTGTWSVVDDAGNSSYTINTAGTITLSGTLGLRGGSSRVFTYTSGTVVTTGTTFSVRDMTATLNLNGISFNNFNLSGISTFTLISNLDINGSSTIGQLGQITTINGNTITIGGSLTIGGTTSIINGTTNIILDGTGTFSSTQITGGSFRLNLTFNTAGTITLSGNINYNTGTLTYTSGTIIPSTSTLIIASSTTLNTNGMSFNNINISGITAITNNSLLTILGTLTYLSGSSVTFLGTSGWNSNNFTISTIITVNHTLKSGITYNISGSFTSITSGNSTRATIKSDSSGVQAILTLDSLGTQNIGYTNATDIDSSLGQTIYSANGTLSNTNNWSLLTIINTNMGGIFTYFY